MRQQQKIVWIVVLVLAVWMGPAKKQGLWKCYYESKPTTRWVGGLYVNGREQGQWSVWYPTGQLKRVGEYRLGRRHGTWYDYAINGERIGVYHYQDGHMVKSERTKL